MARLLEGKWLMQQESGIVHLFEEFTEDEIVSFKPSNPADVAEAQKKIFESDKLTTEEKFAAAFWSGYFYAHGTL
jgi:hypothetical protein